MKLSLIVRKSNHWISIFLLFVAINCAQAVEPKISWDEIKLPEISRENILATQRTANKLQQQHFKKIIINDQFSEKVLKRYLDELDYSHNILLQKDVDQITKTYATKLDDALREGNVSLIFEIYQIVNERRYERYKYLLSLLDKKPNLQANQSIEVDRKKAAWKQTTSEANSLWEKKFKNDVINLYLQNKDWDEVKTVLTKRYNMYIGRMAKMQNFDILQAFLNAVAREIDPHTSYLSPKMAKQFEEHMKLSLEGIGATLQLVDDKTVIRSLVKGSPAEKSKQLAIGDKIVGVGQGNQSEEIEDVVGWWLDEVIEKVKGKKGTTVRLEIEPANGGINRIVTLVRDKIRLEDRAAKLKIEQISGKKIGVLTIPGFYTNLTNEVANLLRKKENHVDALVIDLRSNGGGLLDEAIRLSGLFIEGRPIVQVKDSHSQVTIYNHGYDKPIYRGPVLVVTNRFSASASEIFAAAIQDYNRGLIIGQQTFGKGTVQQNISANLIYDTKLGPLGHIQYTIQKFYRVNGESTQLKGVMPDIKFPELIDTAEYGEEKEDNALVWDKISPAKYQNIGSARKAVNILKNRYTVRIKNDPEYLILSEQIADTKIKNNKKELSLNFKQRKKENDIAEKKSLDYINSRFIREGKSTLEKIDDLPKDYEAPDFYLEQAKQMAADFAYYEL